MRIKPVSSKPIASVVSIHNKDKSWPASKCKQTKVRESRELVDNLQDGASTDDFKLAVEPSEL